MLRRAVGNRQVYALAALLAIVALAASGYYGWQRAQPHPAAGRSAARAAPRGAPTPTPLPAASPTASSAPSPAATPGAGHPATPGPAGPATAPPAPPPAATGLLFDDEFNGTALDTNAWVAMNRPGDASNLEVQCYRPGNAAVAGGELVLTSRADTSCQGYAYTSAMVQWRSFNFLYGTIEVRAREAGGTGTWPSEWLLGADCQVSNVTTPDNAGTCNWPYPGSDEIDITEFTDSSPWVDHQNLITGGNPRHECHPIISDASQSWHVFVLVWQPGVLTWKVDGVVTCTLTQDVPSHPMFLMINTAIGGAGGGTVDAATLPQVHSVDYVRVSR
jgi:beta-glucanase (GH16 family)